MPKILDIITNPDPILRKISKEIDSKNIKSRGFQSFCKDLILTMQKKDGIGLASPQIGKNIRIIVISQKDGPLCMINPKITKKSWAKEIAEEGCLSVPFTFGDVKRHKKINCLYLDLGGEKKRLKAEGLLSRIIQHEIDHLNGILFIDKADNIKEEEK